MEISSSIPDSMVSGFLQYFPPNKEPLWVIKPSYLHAGGMLTLNYRSVLSTAFIYNLPDTPRWYYAKGMIEEGDAVLCRLHNLPVTSLAVDATKSEILASLLVVHFFDPRCFQRSRTTLERVSR